MWNFLPHVYFGSSIILIIYFFLSLLPFCTTNKTFVSTFLCLAAGRLLTHIADCAPAGDRKKERKRERERAALSVLL